MQKLMNPLHAKLSKYEFLACLFPVLEKFSLIRLENSLFRCAGNSAGSY